MNFMNKNSIRIIVPLIAIFLVVLSGFIIPSSTLGIIIDKDTLQSPTSTTLIIDKEIGFDEVKFTLNTEEQSRLRGGCVPLPGGKSSNGNNAAVCKSAGYRDKGCGWNSETACSCKSGQVGCNKVEKTPLDAPVNVLLAGKQIATITEGGSITTNNVASIINEACQSQFSQNTQNDIRNIQCSIPLELNGGKSSTAITYTFVSSTTKKEQTTILTPTIETQPIIIETPNYCNNQKLDPGELDIDCGGNCEKECLFTTTKIDNQVVKYDDIPEEGINTPNVSIFKPSDNALQGTSNKFFSTNKIPGIALIGLSITLIGALLLSFSPLFMIGILGGLLLIIFSILGAIL